MLIDDVPVGLFVKTYVNLFPLCCVLFPQSKSLNCPLSSQVLTVDARNHGNSPHNPVLTYEAMSNDLKHLLSQLHIEKCVLIGHSMGGKTAMTTALMQVFHYKFIISFSLIVPLRLPAGDVCTLTLTELNHSHSDSNNMAKPTV